MAGLFLMFVMTIALSNLVNDYVQSASDSEDSEPTPLIVFTPEDDNTDWKMMENNLVDSEIVLIFAPLELKAI